MRLAAPLALVLLAGCSNGIPLLPEAVDPLDPDFWGGEDGSGGGEGASGAAFEWLKLLAVTIPIVLGGLSLAMPSVRPAVARLLTAVFNLLALPFELLVAVLRQLVPDRWKPERWRDDDLGGTPGGTKPR